MDQALSLSDWHQRLYGWLVEKKLSELIESVTNRAVKAQIQVVNAV